MPKTKNQTASKDRIDPLDGEVPFPEHRPGFRPGA